MNHLLNLARSKYRLSFDKMNNKSLSKIYEIINYILKKNIDLSKENDLKKLSLEDVVKIDQELRGKYQNKIVKILRKEILKKIYKLMPKTKVELRVGVQAKYKFNNSFVKKFGNLKLDSRKNFVESKKFPNCCFPTRAHQDLSNNGFRSTSVLIFFIQLSKNTKKSSMLEVAEFKGNHILENLDSNSKYGNELNRKVIQKKKWIVPSSLKPGQITIMDSLTCHKSKETCELPRIALNIKIQPTNLLYIYKCFGLKKNFYKLKTKKEKLLKLSEDLKKITKLNNGLNFELSVANFLLGDLKQSKISMQKLFKDKLKKVFLTNILQELYSEKLLIKLQQKILKKFINCL